MTFPQLLSGQLAQYSARRLEPARHQEYFFLGGQRQAHSTSNQPITVWQLSYSQLNGEEARALRSFFESLPANESFDFVDPWTGQTFPSCRLASSTLNLVAGRDYRYSVDLEVQHV
jgi:hypothetical protein